MTRKVIVGVLAAAMLMISMTAGLSPQTEAAWTYTVRQGDSLWNIAQRYGTTPGAIQQASHHWSTVIVPGQRLVIPTGTHSAVGNGGAVTSLTSAQRDLLARVVAAEAQGEPYEGKVAVAAVILNRVRDSRFPNTLNGVIHQRHAFESVTNGLVWRRTPSARSHNAVRDAVNGWDPSHGSVFFWNPYKPVTPWIWSRPIMIQIGNHVFAT